MPTMADKRKVRVFIASPGDLRKERKQFRQAIDFLNIGFGDGANVEFEALGWEDTLASTGRRNQSVINAGIDRCDVFFLVMHRRWGQEAPDAWPYSSYTEEEFHRALERWKSEGNPTILVFFKRIEAALEADPGPQLQKVIAFRQELERTRKVLYRYIDDQENAFLSEVDKHLRAYVKGELEVADTTRDLVVLPIAALDEVRQAKDDARRHAQEAEAAKKEVEAIRLRLAALQLQDAERAADFAQKGSLEQARQKFVRLIANSSEPEVLYLAYRFFDDTEDYVSAANVLENLLEQFDDDTHSAEVATLMNNLANLYLIRGDLDAAETEYRKAQALNETLGSKEGLASNYANLGNVYKTRGDLDAAEAEYRKAQALNEALDSREGLANNYANLGNVYQTRGDLDAAMTEYRKSIKLNEILGNKEGLANNYANLGAVHQTRGDLDAAETEYRKAQALNETLGSKEGLANNFASLGNVYQTRGHLDAAMIEYRKALVLNEALGRREGLANNYANLGNVYQTRGDLDAAETEYRKALVLNEVLGSKEGLANNYAS